MRTSHETKRAKKIIVELVRQKGVPFHNKSDLFLAFWRAHLSYAEKNAGYLSNWPMVRTPHGPGIQDFDYLLSELLADAWLATTESQVGDNLTLVISLGSNCPPPSLTEESIAAIRDGVQGSAMANFRESRVWREAKDGEELDIYLDLMDSEERDRRESNLAALAAAIGAPYSTSRK
jgi:hypothetical protein